MDTKRFEVITAPTHPGYRELVRGMTKAAWPEFMLHEQVAGELWHELLDSFPEYQLAMYDPEAGRAAAMGNSFPIRWDEPLENLPDGGWDWAFHKAVRDHHRGIEPNYHCAIQVVIHPDYRSQGLSSAVIEAVQAVTRAKGYNGLIIPVRPNLKSRYPLISIDDYVHWHDEEGLPFDAWLRVHARLGGRIIKICHESKTIRGTVAEWEAWTGMKFPQTGEYVIQGALVPVQVDIAADEGVYVEPNVWMLHEGG